MDLSTEIVSELLNVTVNASEPVEVYDQYKESAAPSSIDLHTEEYNLTNVFASANAQSECPANERPEV